jgi:ASCH domain
LHLAVFAEPFFSLVLEGRKTIESRFSRVRCAPFEAVSNGDIILIKQAGGPICGLVLARQTWFFELDRNTFSRIREQYGDAICADDDFWRSRRNASYATLIELAEPAAIPAMSCSKRDRRGWVPLRTAQLEMGI